jgi:hypothetical protein
MRVQDRDNTLGSLLDRIWISMAGYGQEKMVAGYV